MYLSAIIDPFVVSERQEIEFLENGPIIHSDNGEEFFSLFSLGFGPFIISLLIVRRRNNYLSRYALGIY